MKMFLALQEIASQRGDGLRPGLVRLLERARTLAQMNHSALAPATDREKRTLDSCEPSALGGLD